MKEALEVVRPRRKLQAKEYALLLSDMSIFFPLDHTFASSQGKLDPIPAKRSMLSNINADTRPFGRSIDPNGLPSDATATVRRRCRTRFCYHCRIASILERMSDATNL